MKKLALLALLFGCLMFVHDSESLGRGGAVGGGARPAAGGRAVQSYGGAAAVHTAPARAATPVVGPSGHAAAGGGSYTTKGGSTIDYRGAAVGGTGPAGVSSGKYVGGIQVNTPGGKEFTHVGSGSAVVGPGGSGYASKSGVSVGSGPGGTVVTRPQGHIAVGPQGAVVGGSTRVTGVAKPTGSTVVGTRTGVAVGPYGAVAGRTTVAATTHGTYYRSSAVIRNQGVYVRRAVVGYPCFRPAWFARYPGAWFAAGWTANAVWRACTWPFFVGYGYAAEPIYYDYGINVVYQDDGVYMDGALVDTAEQYGQQAMAYADYGRDAKVTREEEWTPLGVFAMVQGEETTSNHIFQLSINKEGVIRGNYYDAVTDSTAPVVGYAGKKTQRAAWTIGDRKSPVYEVGLANLTRDETTMLVHYSPERTQQFTLVRVPEEAKE